MRRIVSACGQSNERGQWVTQTAEDPLPQTPGGSMHGDPLLPNGNVNGTLWPPVMHEIWKRNPSHVFKFRNTCEGATSIVDDWCGTAGTVPFSDADGGFDPNGYIQVMTDEIAIGSFDERWVFISIGQRDASNGTTKANFAQGIVNVTNHVLSQGAAYRVAIGFTCYQASQAAAFAAELNPGVTSALATFAGNPNVIAGANLYERFGAGLGYVDGVHMDAHAYDRSVGEWVAALTRGGW